mgnify:CR=1 FL=1
MKDGGFPPLPAPELQFAAQAAIEARNTAKPLEASASLEELRAGFAVPLAISGRNAVEVLRELVDVATPGIVGSTDPGFMAWVVGGSQPAGVAADWLTSSWGQNAGLFQTSPAAAVAEETVAKWLVDLLELPAQSSVGFTTGATMAAFTCLAAARLAVLSCAGYDLEEHGLIGAPDMRIVIAEDSHVTNYSALRYLGFGKAQIARVPSTSEGIYDMESFAETLASLKGMPTIVIGQAGHIMSGAFDDLGQLGHLCREHGAWLHVDGAFGLWSRSSARYCNLAAGAELADSWSVDGHKWLQLPYDSGFAIVRDPEWHRAAMRM